MIDLLGRSDEISFEFTLMFMSLKCSHSFFFVIRICIAYSHRSAVVVLYPNLHLLLYLPRNVNQSALSSYQELDNVDGMSIWYERRSSRTA